MTDEVDYPRSMTPSPLPPDVLPPDTLASVEHRLATLDAVPLVEQSAVFEEIHRAVTQVLASTVQQAESAQVPGTR